MNRLQKILVLLTYHTQVQALPEDDILLMISWVINGIDDDKIVWEKYRHFLAALEVSVDPEEESACPTT